MKIRPPHGHGETLVCLIWLLCLLALSSTALRAKNAADASAKHNNTEVTPIKEVAPQYPVLAAKVRLTGWVIIKFSVDKHGRVRDAHVVKAKPPKIFDNAALRAISQWRFQPARVNGKPVKRTTTEKFKFRLEPRKHK